MRILEEELIDRSIELILEYTGKTLSQFSKMSNEKWYCLLTSELEEILHNCHCHENKIELQHLIESFQNLVHNRTQITIKQKST